MPKLERSDSTGEEKLTAQEFEYILKELELGYQAELAGRERAEQMGQFFLTALTALLGASLLVMDSTRTSLQPSLVVSVGAVAVFALGIFTLIRTCEYREAITAVRIRIFLLRNTLLGSGMNSAALAYRNPQVPMSSGFASRAMLFLSMLSLLCSLALATAVPAGIATSLELLGIPAFGSGFAYYLMYGLSFLIPFGICFMTLQAIVRRFRNSSNMHLLAISGAQQAWRKRIPQDSEQDVP